LLVAEATAREIGVVSLVEALELSHEAERTLRALAEWAN
jgi:hypothetical protein